MSASGVMDRIINNSATMSNGLPSTQERKHWDHCCGIHGAARERKGIKRGTSAARRRYEKKLVEYELDTYNEET